MVAIAENGEKAALRMLEEQTFNSILMDVQMPEMGGFEATATYSPEGRRTGRHMPIIALTANAMAEERQLASTPAWTTMSPSQSALPR